jgi:arylsulfatase A-like enzyme
LITRPKEISIMSETQQDSDKTRPNILLITSDQYRYPRFSYGPAHGLDPDLKNVLGFAETIRRDNRYAKYFPGLMSLRQNAVVLRNHTIAASACTPSRATIYTGQYGTRTGVTQTDGLFKNGDSPNFPWLSATGIPTLGNWMREAGYQTHYFGKWHISNPPDHSLDAYGFDNWQQSYPEPHGAQYNNLGIYRDAGFSDAVCTFIRRQALALNYDRVVAEASAADPTAPAPSATEVKPWFAVASFVNPHDIATYPAVISQALPAPDGGTQSIFGPLTVPESGQEASLPVVGSLQIPLNPLGFPQDCAHAPPTQDETLFDKPTCQFDYSYKVGLALAAKTGFNIVTGVAAGLPNKLPDRTPDPERADQAALGLALKSQIPFQLTEDPDAACLDFIQLYGYLHYTVDVQINRVLQTLRESGQADNTIVVFLSDHGELAAAHGQMMEKWHCAYQEAVHVPVVVQFPPADGTSAEIRSIDALTSHIDVLPTVLGLAGVHDHERQRIAQTLAMTRPVPPLPGVDLSRLIQGKSHEIIEPDGNKREGVLFITDDEITMPLPVSFNAHDARSREEYAVYLQTVDAVRHGKSGKGPVPRLEPGPVRQPNHVRCVRTMSYKLARYFDPSGATPQQWEMYDMDSDPNETTNLVEVQNTPTTVRHDIHGVRREELQRKTNELAALLAKLEARDLVA